MQKSAVLVRAPELIQYQRSRTALLRRRLVPWLFVAPILALNLLVVLGPAMSAFYYSLTQWNGIGKPTFIGLDNFHRLFVDDPSFWQAFKHNLAWLAMFLTVPIAMALIAASLLAPIRRGAIAFRMSLFIPYVLPAVVTANVWSALLHPDRGIGAQLAKVGVRGFDKAFLGDPHTVLPAIAFVDNWSFWGFLMVLFLAAIQNVPPDLYEAARLDGASRWEEFRDVTLPGIRPTLVFMIMIVTVWSFLTFNYIYILTQGGPAGASEVLATLVVKAAFRNFEAGYAAAIGLSMSALVGVVITIFLTLRRRGWEI